MDKVNQVLDLFGYNLTPVKSSSIDSDEKS